VLTPAAFRRSEPLERHTWLIRVSRDGVLAQGEGPDERVAFTAADLGFVAAATSTRTSRTT
jgi:hypothetical protein